MLIVVGGKRLLLLVKFPARKERDGSSCKELLAVPACHVLQCSTGWPKAHLAPITLAEAGMSEAVLLMAWPIRT